MLPKLKRKARKIWRKYARQQLIFSVFKKIAVVVLLVGLNWAGIAAIGQTAGYFNDDENSSGNIFSVATLDFSLTSLKDFSPEVTPAQPASRSISVVNDGVLGFQYGVIASNSSGALCNHLNLEANLGGVLKYNGSLAGFTYNAGQFSDPDDWQFTVTLTSSDPGLENQTCSFDFVFDGVQIGGTGFSDREIIPNTVTAGAWQEPTEPASGNYSPIADSYVNQDKPDENKGDDHEVHIKSDDTKSKRIFIKFDLNFPTGTTIISSTMKLFMKNAPSAPRFYEAKRVIGSWTEGGITWDNQPGTDVTPTATTSSGTTKNVWLSWNVTSDVQSFVSGTSNYGWRLSDSVENSSTNYEAKFHSRNSNDIDKRPILEMVISAPAATTSYPVINEVYYDVKSPDKGNDPKNEWVEIYNPTNSPVNISGWKICDKDSCDTIPASPTIPAKGFAIISGESSTWATYWTTIPSGTVLIDLPGDKIGNGLANDGDRVILKNASDTVIDAISYGDDTSQLNPAAPLSGEGKSLARIVKGYDTDSATDWVINATPNPGTNPSVDGIEVMRFTSEGVEVAASEEGLTPLVGTGAIENDASSSFSGTLRSVAGAVTGFISGGEETAASAGAEIVTDASNLAPVASESVEPSLSPLPEPSPETSPEPSVTPEPTETPAPEPTDNPQPATDDGSSVQLPQPTPEASAGIATEPAIPAEPVTVEPPAEPEPPPADPPAPAPAPGQAPAPAETPAATAE